VSHMETTRGDFTQSSARGVTRGILTLQVGVYEKNFIGGHHKTRQHYRGYKPINPLLYIFKENFLLSTNHSLIGRNAEIANVGLHDRSSNSGLSTLYV
jgi:hypothetical protein